MKKYKILVMVVFLAISSHFLNAQKKRSAHWFFGYECGLDFTTGAAMADVTGKLISIEGCAAISDTLGNLLFYTNSQVVWDKNGTTMPGSNGLIGDESSAQSSIIVPKPGSNSLYYLFITRAPSQLGGFYYNIIDMSLNGGMGDINTNKNMLLLNPCTEELAATRHCNGTDYWIVTRQALQDTLKFYAYKLSVSGIAAPVISKMPSTFSFGSFVGVGGLTFSQDGDKLIHSNLSSSEIHVLTFNKQTGQVAMQVNISHYPGEQIYSNALSPDGSKLYVTSWWVPSLPAAKCYLSEFDLSATNINASRKNIDSVDFSGGSPTGFGFIGAVRLGPDQKIYVSRWNQSPPLIPNVTWYNSLDSLGVINAPNQMAPLCNYQQNGLYLFQKPTQLGLPNFVSNFTSDQAIVNTCQTTTVLGIGESHKDIQLEIYPNPFNDKTTLLFNKGHLPQIHVTFTDILGKIHIPVISESPDGLQLERRNLPTGVYYLTIWDDDKIVAQKKLIVLAD